MEVHCAHGYLVDQFLKDGINDRTDEYGGTVAKRCKFLLDVMSAVTGAIGAERTSARLSPIIDHLGASDSNPVALGVHVMHSLSPFDLAYLHVTEPRLQAHGTTPGAPQTCHIYRREYPGVFMSSGGFTRGESIDAIRSGYSDLVSFGRAFVANPDLPLRFLRNLALNAYDRSTFYTHHPSLGYTDYPSVAAPACAVSPVRSSLSPATPQLSTHEPIHQ